MSFQTKSPGPDISRKNVTHNTGGPFGAAVFEAGSGRVVTVLFPQKIIIILNGVTETVFLGGGEREHCKVTHIFFALEHAKKYSTS